ncbi:hypothetical protein M378DRAFT_16936 [Amanita muscaria Koide BX008]|uniref:Uncharacterized protein n=1 Tax=Amanita muscaria (strain Koide BX008) TaxID=946122 RepID=A0A0C2WIY2_AMAMK|nr:hypothetical protein M378DRAFT_16936 [Amanita muscaria Koide BX008]
MVLVASPADSSKLHMINSRSIRRTPVLSRSRSPTPATDASAGGDGSYGGSFESREGDLRRALDAALNGLDVLKNIEGKRRVYAQTALWRKTSDDDDEWAVVDIVAMRDAEPNIYIRVQDFLRRLFL